MATHKTAVPNRQLMSNRRGGKNWYKKEPGESKMARRIRRQRRDVYHLRLLSFMRVAREAKG